MQRQQSYSYAYKAQSINWKISPCLHMKMSWICSEECWSNCFTYCTIPLVFSQGVLWISSDREDRMGAKFKTPKNPYGFKQYAKKSHAKYPSCKNFQRNYAARIYGNDHESSYCFEYPKKSLLKSSYPKKFLPKFPTQKNPKIEDFKHHKILQSPLSLEIQGSPMGAFRQGTKHLVCRLSEVGTKNITTLSCILFLQNAQL